MELLNPGRGRMEWTGSGRLRGSVSRLHMTRGEGGSPRSEKC